MIDLRKLAAIARMSELHDLKVGLSPDEADSVATEIENLQSKLSAADQAWHEQEDELQELRSRLDNALAWYKLAAEQRDALVGRLDSIRLALNAVLVDNQNGRLSDADAMSTLHELFYQWFQKGVVENQEKNS